jgi:glycosyltransferase involved in cell wall biosynthesis
VLALVAKPSRHAVVSAGAGVRSASARRLGKRHRGGRKGIAGIRRSESIRDILLNWHLGNSFGWGIVGLNVFAHWANDPDIRPLMGQPIHREHLGACDPLRRARMVSAIEHSNRNVAAMRADPARARAFRGTVIDALGNDFRPSELNGDLDVGRCIFETLDRRATRAALGKYDALLVASTWNARRLEQATGRAAKVIFEGVDTSLFCPGPKSGLLDADSFFVFSGGKVEFRKGQDIVLLAFKAFHARHPNAVLVTAWHSPWPHLSAGFKGKLAAPVELGATGALDIAKWVSQNGLDPRALIDLGFVDNAVLPAILREMDVALQPSRAEACTSLPVKEAMACGVPVIAALNTGMTDLLVGDNCIALERQSAVGDRFGSSDEGWGESDVEEIVAALEFAYEHRERAREIGIRSRAWLLEHGRTWQAHASELKRWLLSMQ